jgi:hypothetical protein
LRDKLTYANVVSTLALFVVIAGGTAAALPGKKTVQANDMKRNSVKAAAIASNAVRSAEIADGAVTGADVADGGLSYADLGSNSVVARIRSTAPVNTGDGGQASPVTVPLDPSSWTQAGNEVDVAFGEATFRQPAACGNNGTMRAEYYLDGQPASTDFFGDQAEAGQVVTELGMTERPFIFEPGQAANHTLEIRVSDSCQNAGENFVLESIAVNVLGTR